VSSIEAAARYKIRTAAKLKKTVAGIERWLYTVLVTLCWNIEIYKTHAAIVEGTLMRINLSIFPCVP